MEAKHKRQAALSKSSLALIENVDREAWQRPCLSNGHRTPSLPHAGRTITCMTQVSVNIPPRTHPIPGVASHIITCMKHVQVNVYMPPHPAPPHTTPPYLSKTAVVTRAVIHP